MTFFAQNDKAKEDHNVKLTIDGREIQVERVTTLLQAARENDIAIPTLCYHDLLQPYAACRLCIVELASARGKLVPACAYECEEGLVVLTNSPRVRTARRNTAELLMGSGAHLPAVRQIAQAVGVDTTRVSFAPDDCVLCGLCVRACAELVGAHAISLVGRGLRKKVAPPFDITAAACIGCATCVLICPTGALTLDDIAPVPLPHWQEHPPVGHDRRSCRICGLEDTPLGFSEPAGSPAQGVPRS